MTGFNPLKLMQLKSAWDQFSANHPKFAAFLQHITKEGFHEGTIIDITITTPDGRTISSNLKITDADIELINSFIDNTPYISDLQKDFYKTYIKARYEKILLPTYKKLNN